MITNFYYSEKTFAIDLIQEAYNIHRPTDIVAKAEEILSIDVTLAEVMDYLNHTEDLEKESRSIQMADHFK